MLSVKIYRNLRRNFCNKIRTIVMCWSSSRKCRIFFCAIEIHRKQNISAECESIAKYIWSHLYSYKQCLIFHLLLTKYNTYKEVLYMQYIPLSYSIISIKLAADFYFFFNHRKSWPERCKKFVIWIRRFQQEMPTTWAKLEV
jgi:hypothetical protein